MNCLAINVALVPGEAMRERARSWNLRLLKNYPAGFALDDGHVPHITLAQAFIDPNDLDSIWEQVSPLGIGHELHAEAFDFFPKNGLGTAGFDVRQPQWLAEAHRQVVELLEPIALRSGGESAFHTTPDEPTIARSSRHYVEVFFDEHARDKYNPHVTLGRAHREFLEQLRKETFTPFRFGVEALAIFQLGNHGTCARELRSRRVGPSG
ncbi:2'-5' RNA ligase family protein [Gilvimarinus sp. F26214L]|uniref:2'-5' RNA ligase family protein n=1 Tax=Gilvimarinus sp. DZF01 TaxID=3461371 RepID=UPI0040461569